MTIYNPDTCDCVIEYSDVAVDNDGDPKFVKVVNKCKEHSQLKDNACYKAVLSHNRSFNLKHGVEPTKEQVDSIVSDKKIEKARIKKL